VRRSKKRKVPPQSLTAFAAVFEESLVQFASPGWCPERTKTSGPFESRNVRASFARNYGAKGGGLTKSADAQRQAFTRALKAALAEGS
jgi:hypothetical protein